MYEKDVVLEYVCSCCHNWVTAKLKCSGRGVADGPHAVAMVPLACPTCNASSNVYFELSGLILKIEETRKNLEPSLN